MSILSWQWKQMNTGKFIIINYSDAPAKCRIPLKGVSGSTVTEEFSGAKIMITDEARAQGLLLELKPYESKIFTFQI